MNKRQKEVRFSKLKKKLEKPKIIYRKFRYTCEDHNLLITALVLWIFALLAEVTWRTYELYRNSPSVDLISHFISGMALTATAYWLGYKFDIKHHNWFALNFTVLASLAWEILESLQEMVFYNPPYLIDYFFWDGFWDVIIAITAATVFLLLKTFKEKGI